MFSLLTKLFPRSRHTVGLPLHKLNTEVTNEWLETYRKRHGTLFSQNEAVWNKLNVVLKERKWIDEEMGPEELYTGAKRVLEGLMRATKEAEMIIESAYLKTTMELGKGSPLKKLHLEHIGSWLKRFFIKSRMREAFHGRVHVSLIEDIRLVLLDVVHAPQTIPLFYKDPVGYIEYSLLLREGFFQKNCDVHLLIAAQFNAITSVTLCGTKEKDIGPVENCEMLLEFVCTEKNGEFSIDLTDLNMIHGSKSWNL